MRKQAHPKLLTLSSRALFSSALLSLALTAPAWSQSGPPDPLVFKTDLLSQTTLTSGSVSLKDIRTRGLAVFATPFTEDIGYGDGPVNAADPTSPGGRPTLQDNGLHLRVNGLDAQTCIECHSVGSNLTVPFRFGVGGVGGAGANAMFQPTEIDVDDELGQGFAGYNGRFINPPFLFGSGGIELVAKEMTTELQALKNAAISNPDTPVPLLTKGVSFGSIVYTGGLLDTSLVEGVEHDLVVRPFGRKGEFATTRGFDLGALPFHFGMQPQEDVGIGVDGDGDGVSDEISIGDLSALVIFNTTLNRPRQQPMDPNAQTGENLFESIGCAKCHVPALTTTTPFLTYSQPEIETQPYDNVFYSADLRAQPTGFDPAPGGGIVVPAFSDLKTHDMGPGLAESTGNPAVDPMFVTARLWGVADTAPYLHDGRAHTLKKAIQLHGGEAQSAQAKFVVLPEPSQDAIIRFLQTLRTPRDPAADLFP